MSWWPLKRAPARLAPSVCQLYSSHTRFGSGSSRGWGLAAEEAAVQVQPVLLVLLLVIMAVQAELVHMYQTVL